MVDVRDCIVNGNLTSRHIYIELDRQSRCALQMRKRTWPVGRESPSGMVTYMDEDSRVLVLGEQSEEIAPLEDLKGCCVSKFDARRKWMEADADGGHGITLIWRLVASGQ